MQSLFGNQGPAGDPRIRWRQLEVTISDGTKTCLLFPTNILSFVALDAGIMMCRALMNFLGKYYSGRPSGHLFERRTPRYDSNLYLGDFGLTSITIDQAGAGLPGRVPKVVLGDLLVTLKTADIGIGHLTRTAARDIAKELEKVSKTCQLVMALMNQYLYQALGKGLVVFDGSEASRYVREIKREQSQAPRA